MKKKQMGALLLALLLTMALLAGCGAGPSSSSVAPATSHPDDSPAVPSVDVEAEKEAILRLLPQAISFEPATRQNEEDAERERAEAEEREKAEAEEKAKEEAEAAEREREEKEKQEGGSEARAYVGTFTCSGEWASAYNPTLTIHDESSFTLTVNLYEGMGTITGSYEMHTDSITMYVENRDFSGFVGDDVAIFSFTKEDANTLSWDGSTIGVTEYGHIFRRV